MACPIACRREAARSSLISPLEALKYRGKPLALEKSRRRALSRGKARRRLPTRGDGGKKARAIARPLSPYQAPSAEMLAHINRSPASRQLYRAAAHRQRRPIARPRHQLENVKARSSRRRNRRKSRPRAYRNRRRRVAISAALRKLASAVECGGDGRAASDMRMSVDDIVEASIVALTLLMKL